MSITLSEAFASQMIQQCWDDMDGGKKCGFKLNGFEKMCIFSEECKKMRDYFGIE